MIDERREETAALYALGLVEGEERIAFEAEMNRDPELRNLVDELRRLSTGVAFTAPDVVPPPQLKNRILASVDALSAPPAAAARPVPEETAVVRFPIWGWVGWAAAACFAVVALMSHDRYQTTREQMLLRTRDLEQARTETRNLQRRAADRETALETRIAALEKAGDIAELKIAKLASLVGNTAEAVAIAVWDPSKQEGVLTIDRLPGVADDQDYQLWVIDPDQPAPVSAGVFKVNERGIGKVSFRPDRPVTTATKFAISRERKGGAPTPQGAIVAAGSL